MSLSTPSESSPTRRLAHPIPAELPEVVLVVAWHDPTVDAIGHDPRSMYAERYWLGVIGPSALWFLRSMSSALDAAPDGFELDVHAAARRLGLSDAKGMASPFGKAIKRCEMFGTMTLGDEAWSIRRRLPTVSARHLARLPLEARRDHTRWMATHAAGTSDDYRRAIELATVLASISDDRGLLEHQLTAVGVSPNVAEAAARTVAARAA